MPPQARGLGRGTSEAGGGYSQTVAALARDPLRLVPYPSTTLRVVPPIAGDGEARLPKRRLVEAPQLARMEVGAVFLEEPQRLDADAQVLADRALVEGVGLAR